MKKVAELTTKEAIVLQQVLDDEGDDVRGLAGQLSMPYSSLLAIIERLKRKGLITIDKGFGELWVKLTRKGQRLMSQIWPESKKGFATS